MMQNLTIHPPPPQSGIRFVNHEASGRSSHPGHALVEVEPGHVLAFFPNCSEVSRGHNGDGWMEFKRSRDGGRTWPEPRPLDYSNNLLVHDPQRGNLPRLLIQSSHAYRDCMTNIHHHWLN